MQFFAYQHEQALPAILVVALKSLNEDIVVRDEQGVHTSLQPGIGEVLVQPTSVRKASVHVYGGDQFLHTVIITPESS